MQARRTKEEGKGGVQDAARVPLYRLRQPAGRAGPRERGSRGRFGRQVGMSRGAKQDICKSMALPTFEAELARPRRGAVRLICRPRATGRGQPAQQKTRPMPHSSSETRQRQRGGGRACAFGTRALATAAGVLFQTQAWRGRGAHGAGGGRAGRGRHQAGSSCVSSSAASTASSSRLEGAASGAKLRVWTSLRSAHGWERRGGGEVTGWGQGAEAGYERGEA